jgi:hypothetical protein
VIELTDFDYGIFVVAVVVVVVVEWMDELALFGLIVVVEMNFAVELLFVDYFVVLNWLIHHLTLRKI